MKSFFPCSSSGPGHHRSERQVKLFFDHFSKRSLLGWSRRERKIDLECDLNSLFSCFMAMVLRGDSEAEHCEICWRVDNKTFSMPIVRVPPFHRLRVIWWRKKEKRIILHNCVKRPLFSRLSLCICFRTYFFRHPFVDEASQLTSNVKFFSVRRHCSTLV